MFGYVKHHMFGYVKQHMVDFTYIRSETNIANVVVQKGVTSNKTCYNPKLRESIQCLKKEFER